VSIQMDTQYIHTDDGQPKQVPCIPCCGTGRNFSVDCGANSSCGYCKGRGWMIQTVSFHPPTAQPVAASSVSMAA